MTAVFSTTGPLTTTTIPDLCDRLASFISSNPADVIVCDLAALPACDLATVDALARLQLTARRHGRSIQLRHAPQRLNRLINLCGLNQELPTAAEPLEPTLAAAHEPCDRSDHQGANRALRSAPGWVCGHQTAAGAAGPCMVANWPGSCSV